MSATNRPEGIVNLELSEVQKIADTMVTVEMVEAVKAATATAEEALESQFLVTLKLGVELEKVKRLFKSNNLLPLADSFLPYAMERCARGKASVEMYCKLGKNEAKVSGIAKSIRHAHDIIGGKTEADGTYKEKATPKVKNDADFQQDLIKLLPRFKSVETIAETILKNDKLMAVLAKEYKITILKEERARVRKAKKASKK